MTALNVRSEADAIAKHLTSKGYSAYVSANGTPAIYRVRVGSFKTRREAETVAAKLQKEEQVPAVGHTVGWAQGLRLTHPDLLIR